MQKANALYQKIRELQEALSCFEYQPYPDSPDKEKREKVVSTNPELIVEYDGDGREKVKLPLRLNESLIETLKLELMRELEKTIQAFDDL